MPERLADYFFVATLQVDLDNPESDDVEPIIIDRYPKKDHKNAPFPEDACVFCFNEGNVVKYRDIHERKPYFFPFCFTKENRDIYYGTVLMFYETLLNDGQEVLNKDGNPLYVPKALCVTSSRPIFSVFTVFLREVYRNTIIHNDINEDPTVRTRKTSFESGLRKGSIREVMPFDDDCDFPIERHIRYFFDVYPYLEPRMHLNMTIFDKIFDCIIPPKFSIPYADKLTFDCLFDCLSPKNIVKVVSYMLLDQRIVFVSSQVENLTLCCEALLSLMWPFKCIHPYIPVLPTFLLESIEAPTPIILGMLTSTFELDYIQENIKNFVIVHLDINKVIPPKGSKLPTLPRSFQKELKKYFETEIPALPIRVLYCDGIDIQSSKYVVFEVTFGPGHLGFELHEGKQVITEGEEPTKVLILTDDDSTERKGSQAHLFKLNPCLISVNGEDVLSRPLDEVVNKIDEAPRPLIIRFQVGTCPKTSHSSSEIYATVDDTGTPIPLSPVETDPVEVVQSPQRSILEDVKNKEMHKYYNKSKKPGEKEEGLSDSEKRANFVVGLRGRFIVQMIKMLNNYLAFINGSAVPPDPIFNSIAFLNQCDEDYYKFLDVFLATMTFNNFIQLSKDEEDEHIDIDYFGELMSIYSKEGEEAVFDFISPKNWNLVDITIPPPTGDGLPENWFQENCARLFENRFPRLNPDYYGDKIKRIKVDIPADKTIHITPLVLRRRQVQRSSVSRSFKLLGKGFF